MSERIPVILGSVGWIFNVEHPISGARCSIDSMHSAFENRASRRGVPDMRSSADLTILLSTLAARPIAESVSSISPQYALPSTTLMPCESRSLATFSCEGSPSKSSSIVPMAMNLFMRYIAFLYITTHFPKDIP